MINTKQYLDNLLGKKEVVDNEGFFKKMVKFFKGTTLKVDSYEQALILNTKLVKVHQQPDRKKKLDQAKPMSIVDIMEIKASVLSTVVFKLLTYDSETEETFLGVKRIQMEGDKVLLQIMDVTDTITKQKIKMENESLSVLNACVSHELRNPLNSISASNVEQ